MSFLHTRTSSLAAATLVALLVGRCEGGSTAIPLASLERVLADAACQQLATCPLALPEGAVYAALARHPGRTSCADLYERAALFPVAPYRGSIDAGRIVYDGIAARACVDALAVTCGGFDQVLVGDANCQTALRGTVALGGSCAFDEDCAGDGRCVLGASCPGTCHAAPTIGEPCDALANPCSRNVPGAVLDCTTTALDTTMHCVAKRYPRAELGGTCGILDGEGDEQVQTICEPGSYCALVGASLVGTCVPPLAIGETCIPGFDACVDDAVCGADGSGGRRCVAFTTSSTPGSPCSYETFQHCNPLDRLRCDAGACTLLGTGEVDQYCRTFLPSDCNAGLYCDPERVPNICRPQLPDGSTCMPGTDDACASGHCDGLTDPSAPVCGTPRCGG